DEIEAFREELTDRFAELPPEAEALLAARELAVCARRRSVATLTLGPGGCAITVGKGAEGLDRAGFVRKDERWIRKPEGREALATSDIVAALEDGEGSAQVDEPLVTG
ncbi:MAG: TRCF domain-containing protein, partial [Novosphingobium sp.]